MLLYSFHLPDLGMIIAYRFGRGEIMINNKDIEKLTKLFATKWEFICLEERMSKKMDDNTTMLRGEMLGFHDEVMKKLTDILQEQHAFLGLHLRNEDRIDNHEKRIRVLERN
jgi:hypothetical protein